MSTSTPSSTSPTYPSLPSTLILTSTKSYFSPTCTLSYLTSLLSPTNVILPVPADVLFALIPDHLTIYPCSQLLIQHTDSPSPSSWPLALGAQDCFPSTTYGAFTGFTVPQALKDLGVTIVELGHAERRRLVGETDTSTAAKAAAVTALSMIPLVCIGELDAPDLKAPMSAAVGNAMRKLTPQITSLLAAIPADAPVIFAYEPVWAIGAAQPAGVTYVGPVVQAIRAEIKRAEEEGGQKDGNGRGKRRTGTTRVVYGGSAGPGLWSGKETGGEGLADYVDGMFLGRFAHEIAGVKDVVDEVVQSLKERRERRE